MALNEPITDMMLPNNERALIAQAFIKSGLFSMGGTREHPISQEVQLARAFVKVQAGYEHGFQPFYSMQNFNIIQGKISMSAQAVGAKIKESKRYDYDVVELTDIECSIQFIKDGKKGYRSTFTIADAKRAGLVRADSGWVKYPRAMLFARSITQGGNIECPEVLKGIITSEESEDREYVDPETGEIKIVEAVDLIGAPDPEERKTEAKEKAKTGKAKTAAKEKAKTATAEQTAEGPTSGADNRVGHKTEKEASSDDKTAEKGLFEDAETAEGEKPPAGNYPPDLPIDPGTIMDVSRLYKLIHDHCGINPTTAWQILGIANTPELFAKYTTLADAFIKVWDHYTINKAKTE